MNNNAQEIINEVINRFGEHLEMYEDQYFDIMINTLANMVYLEREKNQHLTVMAYRK